MNTNSRTAPKRGKGRGEMKHWTDSIPTNACADAVAYCKTQRSFAAAWKDCKRGDWMLWILGRLAGPVGDPKRKPLVLAACACARLSLKRVKKGEDRPRLAIETAERWARGKATIKQVQAAAAAAANAYAAAAADAAYAAYAVDAADADYATYADYAAADAYAAGGADYAAATAARTGVLAQCAGIVRVHYPRPPKLEPKP